MRIIGTYSTTTWWIHGARYNYQRARVEDYYTHDPANRRAWRWFLFDGESNHIGDFRTLRELREYVESGAAA